LKNGRTLYPDSAKITLSVQENQGREGTGSHKHFETARASPTVGDYREAGGRLKYLYWFQGRGKLVIS
jgi:hypothetical protein